MSTNENPNTPPLSPSSPLSKSRKPSLSLDLSDLPPLIQPAPASNTLLVTNLQDPAVFAPTTLAHLRQLITASAISEDALHTFSPLRAFRRIIITFLTIEAATAVRGVLDGQELFGNRVRVYFGAQTAITLTSDKERHLQAPKAQKQFFISPPPSPPAGWESKDEGPPNTEVHAEDLLTALVTLDKRTARKVPINGDHSDTSIQEDAFREARARRRSGSVRSIVYQPEAHGNGLDLPAIAVEDTTGDGDDLEDDREDDETTENVITAKIMAHTARPPVELMS